MTFEEALKNAEAKFEEEPYTKADAWWLFSYATSMSRQQYYLSMNDEMPSDICDSFFAMVNRRLLHEPIQYIMGTQSFYGMDFEVSPAVLIPRPETEELVELALSLLKPNARVMDMCSGSGCILLSVLTHSDAICGDGFDISDAAIEVARKNAILHNVKNATFTKSDLFENATSKYDMILSNPPYVTSAEMETLSPEVDLFEPHLALEAGDDGLDIYKRIVPESVSYLNNGGYLLFEIGINQGEAVSSLMKENGFVDVFVKRDLSGRDRIVGGKLDV